ncbi:MAG: ABC transporter ATP-binding protein [Candidatus Latescibacterota bacterium]
MANAIEIRCLHKAFGSTVAVEDLSLSVPAGCFFGFLGPNGSGKSTTIGCLTGLLDPTDGEVRLLGERFTSDSVDLKRRIGVLPETLGLFDGLYAHEFLAFQARLYGLDEATTRHRVTELLEALELADRGKVPLGSFSAGMRKRVAFAASLVHRPEILFLDEPFESVDPAGVALMKTWLRELTGQGRTVFMTSHVLETVERVCDRVAIIRAPGHVVWEGDISALAAERPVTFDGQEFRTLEPSSCTWRASATLRSWSGCEEHEHERPRALPGDDALPAARPLSVGGDGVLARNPGALAPGGVAARRVPPHLPGLRPAARRGGREPGFRARVRAGGAGGGRAAPRGAPGRRRGGPRAEG